MSLILRAKDQAQTLEMWRCVKVSSIKSPVSSMKSLVSSVNMHTADGTQRDADVAANHYEGMQRQTYENYPQDKDNNYTDLQKA